MNRKELIADITEILPNLLPFPEKAHFIQRVGLITADSIGIGGLILSSIYSSQGEFGQSFLASMLGFHSLCGSFMGRAAIQYGILKKR